MESFVVVIWLIVCVLTIDAAKENETACAFASFECDIAGSGTTSNRSRKLNCCQKAIEFASSKWDTGAVYVSSFLATLKSWNCSQFERECETRSYAFTPFTSLLYSKYCNHSEVEMQCNTNLQSVVRKQHGEIVLMRSSAWENLVQKMDVLSLNDEDLADPCVQIAMLEKDETPGQFFEIIVIVPFCDVVWCGFNKDIFDTKSIFPWTCMATGCRASVIIIIAVGAILNGAIILGNITILAVLFTDKKLQNAQAIYKMSLAFADFLVGVFVFPLFIVNFLHYFTRKLEPGDSITGTKGSWLNSSSLLSVSLTEVHKSLRPFCSEFSRSYLNAMGFFTVLSLAASTCTLAAAAADRFVCVYWPFTYSHSWVIKVARVIVLFCWMYVALIASLPLFITDLRYTMQYTTLALPGSISAAVVTLLAVFIPLLIMWVFTVTTYKVYVRRKNSMRLSGKSKAQVAVRSRNLLNILAIMVGVFTLCLFPTLMYSAVRYFTLFQPIDVGYASAEVVAVVCFLTNSLWNFFIYSGRDRPFRIASKELFLRLFCGKKREKAKASSVRRSRK